MYVRDIRTSYLLISIRAVYSMFQHIVLPRSDNTNVMTEVDQMVMFCLMTKRMINLVRFIVDFIITVVNAERKRHATLPYGMFLTRVFIRAQLPIDGHRIDSKRPTTIMKTFSILDLKPQALKRRKRKRKITRRRKILLSKKPVSRR